MSRNLDTEKAPYAISDRDMFERHAKKHGHAVIAPWANKNSIFLEWIPLFHQMTIRELIDFMKTENEKMFPSSPAQEIFSDDNYYLSQTPLRLIYDAQQLWFQILSSSDIVSSASDTTAIRSGDDVAVETLDRSD